MFAGCGLAPVQSLGLLPPPAEEGPAAARPPQAAQAGRSPGKVAPSSRRREQADGRAAKNVASAETGRRRGRRKGDQAAQREAQVRQVDLVDPREPGPGLGHRQVARRLPAGGAARPERRRGRVACSRRGTTPSSRDAATPICRFSSFAAIRSGRRRCRLTLSADPMASARTRPRAGHPRPGPRRRSRPKLIPESEDLLDSVLWDVVRDEDGQDRPAPHRRRSRLTARRSRASKSSSGPRPATA